VWPPLLRQNERGGNEMVELSSEQKSRIADYVEEFRDRFRHELSDESAGKRS